MAMGKLAVNRWLRDPSTTCWLRQAVHHRESIALPLRLRTHVHITRRCISSASLTPEKTAEDDQSPRADRKRRRQQEQTPLKLDESPDKMLRTLSFAGGNDASSHIPSDQMFQALSTPPNIQSSEAKARRLIDEPGHEQNMKLWITLLEYRQRIDGFDGVLDIWQALKKRGIDLPIEGEDASILWPAFVNACIALPISNDQENLLTQVIQYAQSLKTRTGQQYAALYTCVIGRWLRIKGHENLVHWHKLLVNDLGSAHVDLRALAGNFAANPGAYRQFKIIHAHFAPKNLYDHYIPALLEHHSPSVVLRWHKAFLRVGDAPSPDVFAMPAVQILFELDGNTSLPMLHQRQQDGTSSTKPAIDASQTPSLTRSNMSAIVGAVHGIKQKEMSDSFVAKMFATRAFSLDMVFNGLGFFGIEKLGPLAMREMALRVGSATEFSIKLVALRRMGIQTNQAIYCRLLEKVSSEFPYLFEALIASDEHPEVFEDSTTQESLLASFLDRGENANAHLALLALSIHGKTGTTRAWNRLLQHYIEARDYQTVARLVEQVKTWKMVLTKRTLTFMHRCLLPKRNPGKAPPNHMPDGALGVPPLQFTTNAYMYAAECGIAVNEKLWIENLKRFGMLHRWEELERLVLWLANFYAKRDRRDGLIYDHGKASLRRVSVIHAVLDVHMKKALVVWGFRTAGWRKVLKAPSDSSKEACEPWARGVHLLKKLDESGVKTNPTTVKDAVLGRMWILFGPAWSSKGINEDLRRDNKLSLAHYIKHADELWDGKLFALDPILYEGRNYPALLVAIFGRSRIVSKKRHEEADVCAWARALKDGHRMPHSRNTPRRQRYWERSPHRMVKLPAVTSTSSDHHSLPHPPQHQSPPAHSSSSYQPPTYVDNLQSANVSDNRGVS